MTELCLDSHKTDLGGRAAGTFSGTGTQRKYIVLVGHTQGRGGDTSCD